MNKSKVYISGPITSDPDYKDKFSRAEDKLRADGYIAVNPTVLDGIKGLDYEEYMALDLQLLDICNAIYMLKGWENSRGVNREYGYALGKDMIVLKESD